MNKFTQIAIQKKKRIGRILINCSISSFLFTFFLYDKQQNKIKRQYLTGKKWVCLKLLEIR